VLFAGGNPGVRSLVHRGGPPTLTPIPPHQGGPPALTKIPDYVGVRDLVQRGDPPPLTPIPNHDPSQDHGYELMGGGGSSLVANKRRESRFERDLNYDPALAYENVLRDGAEFRAGISQAQDWADALTARGPNRGFASTDLLPLLAGVPGSSPYDQWKPEDNHPGLRPDWKDDPGTDPIEVIEQLQLPIELAGGQSFDINKRAGALGGRSGEQLRRLLESGLDNTQLNNELKIRNLKPTGVNLPRVESFDGEGSLGAPADQETAFWWNKKQEEPVGEPEQETKPPTLLETIRENQRKKREIMKEYGYG